MQSKENINLIFDYLNELHPNPKCELHYDTPFQLLIAVILSAQCTDKRVNEITPILFKKYATADKLANADIEDVENIIKPLGFYRNKSKSIVNCSRQLIDKFNGEVPNDVDKLQQLSGVGRKTANVVTAEIFNANNIGVDTHVFRVSHRLDLSCGATPLQVELDLKEQLQGRKMNVDHYLLVLFGRYHCKAVKPNCQNCKLKSLCKYYNDNSTQRLKNNLNATNLDNKNVL